MKNLNTKSLLVVTILFTSVFAIPTFAMAQEKDYNDVFNFDQVNVGIFEGFKGGFGAIFGDHLGYGGKILGRIFETLFLQGLNLSKHEMLGSTFVLSANRTFHERGTYNFAAEQDTRDVYLIPPDYYNLSYVEPTIGYTAEDIGNAYCIVEKEGEFNYDIEVGAGVTLIIWDSDKSFITAVNKLLNFFKQLMTYEFGGGQIPQDLIQNGISLLTWFLIHINDIFTGDELFILNPITWQKLDINPGPGFRITKKWYITGNDSNPLNDEEILTDIPSGNTLLSLWNSTAQS
ncbi:MAG: hypothetical protein ACFFEY_19375, partial [Candidatus Thorarchaeota archaeon]